MKNGLSYGFSLRSGNTSSYRYKIECNNIGWDSFYHLSLGPNSGPPETCEVGT